MKKISKVISILLCICMLISVPVYTSAADSAFEKSLNGFPESYKVYLRALHKQHPKWEFTPMKTGLKWDTAVANELKNYRSLVSDWSAYSNVYKSKEYGDYNYSTEKYIQKDGGFVASNKLGVAYFMDPRNSLNEENIFQFEDLSFDSSFNVEAIGVILSNAYCPPEYRSNPREYYEIIYNAGKTYNVNPCYLAAKIKGEIGTGSASVYGTNSSYPGIYNFYNIGATDGAGAITRGLAWAASGSSYHRPWNTAKKSIIGGAEFIAANYISEGQYTGYLQKFNVNPKSGYGLYNHQYMTNVTGSMSQGYSTYYSYLSIGIIDNHFKFSIPVFENMQGENDDTGTIVPTDAENQKGKITASSCNVRKGPSTNNSAYGFQLTSGTAVTILDIVKTDSKYYDSILRYPYWYHIKFTYDSTTYKGYVPFTFVSVSSKVEVKPGNYTPLYNKSNKNLSMNLISYDERYATIVDDKTIKFTGKGNVQIGFYDSVGHFNLVNYVVTDNPSNPSNPEPITPTAPSKVKGLSASKVTQTSFTLSWNYDSGATGYKVYLYDNKTNSYSAYKTTSDTSCSITGLSPATDYKVKVKAYKKASGETLWGSFSSVLTVSTTFSAPAAPTGLKQTASTSNSVTIQWNKVSGAEGYDIYKYNKKTDKFELESSDTENSCDINGLSTSTSYKLKVKAYLYYNGKKYSSDFSKELTIKTGPAVVTGIKQVSTTKTSYMLKWNEVKDASGYKVYNYNPMSESLSLVGNVSEPKMKISKLKSGEIGFYKVVAYSKSSGNTYYSMPSEPKMVSTLPDKIGNVSQSATKSTGYTLTWKPVNGASGYCIYKADSKGNYKKIATVGETKAIISSLKEASGDKYKIRAFIKIDNTTLFGDYSDIFTAYTAPGKVTGIKKTNISSGGYKISWPKVSGASGYKIYIYSSSTNKYTALITTKSNYISVSSSSGKSYAIKAYKKINNETYFSDYSEIFTVK